MALELLYGPANIKVGGTDVVAAAGFTWMQGLGLLAVLDPGAAYGFYAVQMDGTAEGPRSSYNGSGFGSVLNLSGKQLAVSTTTHLYNFDYLAGRPDATSFLTGTACQDITVITPDRYLGFFDNGSGVQAQATTDGTIYTAEYTFTGPSPGTLVNVSRSRSPTEVCLTFSSGQMRFYDTTLKAQVGDTLFIGEAPDGCWYVPKFDIFVEVKSLQIKILADVTAPYSLSNPVATPTVEAGVASSLSVQLLGAQSEPCVDELINWSIASGEGSLAVSQSATDLTGTALNTLVIPVGSTGTVTVDAELNY